MYHSGCPLHCRSILIMTASEMHATDVGSNRFPHASPSIWLCPCVRRRHEYEEKPPPLSRFADLFARPMNSSYITIHDIIRFRNPFVI